MTTVAHAMTVDVLTIDQTATLSQAARALRKRNVGSAVVLDESGGFVGMIEERQLVDAVAAGRNPDVGTVQLWMHSDPVTVEPSASPQQAAELMRVHQLRHLPVLEDGALRGVISIRDLLLRSQST